MRIPKVLIFILFGLPAFLLPGRGAARPPVQAAFHKAAGPALREAARSGVLAGTPILPAGLQDLEKPLNELRTAANRVSGLHPEAADPLRNRPATLRLLTGTFQSRRKMQAAAYREHASELYGRLIFPHHDFW